jgi:effector-binding domain-containing protein
MLTEPAIVDRRAQPYAAVRASVSMEGGEFAAFLDEAWPAVFARLGSLGVEPAGPPFIRYHIINMQTKLQIEVGVPVSTAIDGDGRVKPGIVPAGRFATLTYTGHYDGLMGANEALQLWAEDQGLRWDMRESPDGEEWGARLELYLTDPEAEPNPDNWRTEVAYRLADD